jgi:hypothetical protein
MLQTLNNVGNTLGTRSRIACRTAKSHQKTNMATNAIADSAKARQVDEKTLLENGRQRIVEVGSLCESPQILSNLGSRRCETEEIRKNPESLLYAIFKV